MKYGSAPAKGGMGRAGLAPERPEGNGFTVRPATNYDLSPRNRQTPVSNLFFRAMLRTILLWSNAFFMLPWSNAHAGNCIRFSTSPVSGWISLKDVC